MICVTSQPSKQGTKVFIQRVYNIFSFNLLEKMVYKWCIVPQCTNTSIKTPQKLFVSVPTNPKRRNMWLQLARRDPNSILSHTNVFMCEDHFDMEKDTVNYLKYKMGFSLKILLTDEAVPSKFFCQGDRKRRLGDPDHQSVVIAKRKRMELLKQFEEGSHVQSQDMTETVQKVHNIVQEAIAPDEETPKTQDRETTTDLLIMVDKSIQVTVKANVHYRSKLVQTIFKKKNISTSPCKVSTTSRFTSPFKIQRCHLRPSLSGAIKAVKKNIFHRDENSDSDISGLGTVTSGQSSPIATSSSRVTDSDSNVTETNENIEQLMCRKNTMRLIQRKPLMYIGINKDCYFLINLLQKHTNIKEEYILLCLKKIRLNITFSELEDNFGISLSYASKLFLTNIPIIASFLKPFIVNLNQQLIKKNLPISFRHNYHNVSCIIDCLEIDIQKPSKALHQALTWSEYKKGNTVKYLISCTPNGLVNFMSEGFGGRTSDVVVVENCKFLDGLPQGTVILADRGFKHLEQMLSEKGMKLLRPPSVSTGEKLSKDQVRQTKIIASLRIHIERVIRRIREFHMLKQHSVINLNILRVLDHIIIIACSLINLQDSIIR